MTCNLQGRDVEMILVNNSCRLSCSQARLMSLRGKLEAMSKLRIILGVLLASISYGSEQGPGVRARRIRSSAIICKYFELENVRFGAKDRSDHGKIMLKGYHARAGLSQYWSKALIML